MQKTESRYDFGFFKLLNNHDKAIVRLLHENYDDFSRRPVHNVQVPEYKYGTTINCLRDDSEPQSKCPFCSVESEKISKRRKRVYIEFLVYKIMDKTGKVLEDFTESPRKMVWERDRRFDDKLFSLSSRYPRLCDVVFQVERFGEAGSTDTQYDIYQIDVDKNLYPYELPEKLYNPDGIQVYDKTEDEMNYYIENGNFPPDDDGEYERRADVEISEHRVPDVPLAELEKREAQTSTTQTSTMPQTNIPAQQQTSAQSSSQSNSQVTTRRRI